MRGKTVRIRSRYGGEFDCYLVAPDAGTPVPAVVLASTVRGVDADLRAIAREFGTRGFIAAAPDLFWRAASQPRPDGEGNSPMRRIAQIESGECDMADTLAHLCSLRTFSGRAAAMGFCYGGPYAILGPKRLGFAAGISCHGTQMLDFLRELECVDEPVCVAWGDRDRLAPAEVLRAFREASALMPNLEVHVFPGVLHGYMMRRRREVFDPAARAFSMARALAILDGLAQAQGA